MAYKVTKTHLERCAPAGREAVRQAKEAHRLLKESSNKSSYNAAKDAASYLVGQSRGRVMVTIDPQDYERIFRNAKKHNG